MFLRRYAAYVLAFALVATFAFADTPEVSITLEVGASKDVPGATGVGTDDPKDIVDVDGVKITGKKPGTTKVTYKQGDQEVLVATVDVTEIEPIIELHRGNKPVALTNPVPVLSGEDLALNVQGHESDGAARSLVGVVVSPAEDAIKHENGKLTIGELKHDGVIDAPPSIVPVTIKLPDNTTQVINFLVIERPVSVSVDLPVAINEDTTQVIPVTVTGSGGGRYHSAAAGFAQMYSYNCTADQIGAQNIVSATTTGTSLKVSKFVGVGGDVPKFNVSCNAFALDPNAGKSGSRTITVLASGGRMRLTPPSLEVFSGEQRSVNAEVFDRNDKPLQGTDVTWTVEGGGDAAILSKQSPLGVFITATKDPTKIPESGVVNIKATTKDQEGREITAMLPLKIVTGSGFTHVRGSLEMLDFQTAKDLYGSQTAKDFFVAKITLLNDLSDDNAGASILVFSSSLGIGVNLQKAEWKSNRLSGRDVPNMKWEAVQFKDLRTLGLPARYPAHLSDLPRQNAPGEPIDDLDLKPVYTCDDIWYAEQPLEYTAEESKDPKLRELHLREREERIAAARLRQIRYRPYPYDMVIKSFDPRDNRTARSITFRALTFAGAVASFVTGVPNFKASEELSAVNEKVGSVLVPALAVLFPSLKETQRQNLVDDTMHPIEEIPYAASLTKMIFLPKFPFQGFKADTWFRISEICPFDFQVEVAISRKREQQNVRVQPVQP